MKHLIEYRKYLYLLLAVVAIGGIFLPLLILNIDFFGNGTTFKFSLLTLFQIVRNANRQLPSNGILQIGQINSVFSEIARTIVLPFLAYLLMILLIAISTAFSYFDKFKIATNVMFGIILVIDIYIGFVFTAIPVTLDEGLVEGLQNNPLMSLIDVSSILNVNLGYGYWLTLISIIMLVVAKFIIEKYKKNVVQS